MSDTKDLTILGNKVSEPTKQLETFKAPEGVVQVTFETDELTSNCPLTHQPDFYTLKIVYRPKERCVESKSLKLYLWTFRNSGQFCEDLSRIILNDIVAACSPESCSVFLKMKARGGITIEAVADYFDGFEE